ncbi:MAG: nucleoside-diphosphate kinase [Prevotella sp.]|nr:nucleoside-diphosphate kinase [Prevotella sp.]
MMEKTLVLLKPSCVQRQLIGEIVNRFERRGLRVAGMKMMQLSDEILREHYAHLVDRPFFPSLAASMQASPVVALALEGVDAVQVVRTMTGSTNGREAAPGTIRGDYSMSNQQNIVHASDSTSNAEIELKRFFRDEEIFEYPSATFGFIYGEGEAK